MAKYIVDIPEDTTCFTALRYEDGRCVSARSYIIPDLTPYVRSESYIDGLKEGQNDAWEFARELIHCNNGKGMQDDELQSCFGYELYSQVFKHLSYQEARDKYEAWKKQKDEIRVGDEVTSKFGDGVVIDIVADESVHILGKDGHWNEYADGEYCKTGRHFDEVEKLMKRMREE